MTLTLTSLLTIPKIIFRIKGIKIEYEKDDYRTAIVSDIIVNMPEFSFKADTWTEETHYSLKQPFQDYVLVAEGAIKSSSLLGTTLRMKRQVVSVRGLSSGSGGAR